MFAGQPVARIGGTGSGFRWASAMPLLREMYTGGTWLQRPAEGGTGDGFKANPDLAFVRCPLSCPQPTPLLAASGLTRGGARTRRW
eukprot:COSAG04_NODE_404_length_14877_cov_7.858371_8_plen_86_part_00